MSSNAQIWARKRNWSKRVIMGMIASIGPLEALTTLERESLYTIQRRLRTVVRDWDYRNEISKRSYAKKT